MQATDTLTRAWCYPTIVFAVLSVSHIIGMNIDTVPASVSVSLEHICKVSYSLTAGNIHVHLECSLAIRVRE